MLVTPAKENIKKLKLKVKEMTRRKWFQDSPLLKISALNAVLRGWINYYGHTNTKRIAKDLDFWVNERMFLWLSKRHKVSKRKVLDRFKLRENGKRWNFGVVNGDNYLFLYRMSDLPLKKYRSRSPDNPYLEGFGTISAAQPENPLSQRIWMGNAENVTWRELKEKIKAQRGAQCEKCGSPGKLDLHHIKPRKSKGEDVEENLQLLCRTCHAQTPSFGRR
jgi:hypothetical protein